MHKDIESILVSEQQIEEICERLGKQITEDYKGKDLLVIGLLKGCVPFMAKLIGKIDLDFQIDFMNVSSYVGTKSSLEVKIIQDLEIPVTGRNVLIAEDIVDTGHSLTKVIELLKYRGAKSVEVATLLDKPEGRLVEMTPKYVGTKIPNAFVVGFGLDYNELYRNIPYVGILKREVYEGENSEK